MEPMFRPVQEADIESLHAIYDSYIRNSTATFQITPITHAEMRTLLHPGDAFYRSYVICDGPDDAPAGYVLFSQFRPREAFRPAAEVTVYLRPEAAGKGFGTAALQMIEAEAAKAGIHTLISLITGENTASIRLFEKAGYIRCACYREIGEKFGRKLDLLAYQKML